MWSMGITLYVLTFFVNPFSDIEDTVHGALAFPQMVSEDVSPGGASLYIETLHYVNRYAGPELEMWSMGITLYVLTFFVNPFSDIEDTVHGALAFPQMVSEDMEHLLRWMLCKEPAHRCSVPQLMSHPWIKQPVNISNYIFHEVIDCDRHEANPEMYFSGSLGSPKSSSPVSLADPQIKERSNPSEMAIRSDVRNVSLEERKRGSLALHALSAADRDAHSDNYSLRSSADVSLTPGASTVGQPRTRAKACPWSRPDALEEQRGLVVSSRPQSMSLMSQCGEEQLAGEYSKHYVTLKQIGKGAYGCVKMAYRRSDRLLTVAKFILKEKVGAHFWVDGPDGRKVPLELSLLTTLKHPNIVSVLDVFENDKYFQMVMEKHGAGMDLFEFIERRPRLDEPLISYIFRQIGQAVEYLHSLNILHRDIKDENVIIDNKFHVKLIDFGSATFMSPDTLFSTFYGTTEYCSPEVLTGNKYVLCDHYNMIPTISKTATMCIIKGCNCRIHKCPVILILFNLIDEIFLCSSFKKSVCLIF
ncbi:PAS domain-containing serine/threonine-protein kinase [Papilio xuthus]|uniref:PAS domain-containing serine/threonine-protein kinase n=1 Tax=Papilio xuthus TaxID=66420 RepID=A0A0N0PAQ1_PAPXU|nr:PAS domain-containing serine/threonine-protein kinase [Papilio xuthus]